MSRTLFGVCLRADDTGQAVNRSLVRQIGPHGYQTERDGPAPGFEFSSGCHTYAPMPSGSPPVSVGTQPSSSVR
jgi:hypothetical protein